MTPSDEEQRLTDLLCYIYYAAKRHRVVYGIHVQEDECAPLFARNLIEKRLANWGESTVHTSRRGEILIRSHRRVEAAAGYGPNW